VVYRVHEPPTREKLVALRDYFHTIGKNLALGQVITPSLFNRMIKDIADEAEKALVMEAVLRSQTQAYYGPKNAGHFGLSLGSYAHFTSPIRRYADLLVHRALVDSFGSSSRSRRAACRRAADCPRSDRADLSKVTDAISQTERRAMEAERDTIDRYVAAWLSGRVGETFRTRITGVQSFGFFATIVGPRRRRAGARSPRSAASTSATTRPRALWSARTPARAMRRRYARVRLGEANPLTGALKFEVRQRRRGDRPRARGRGEEGRSKHPQGQRGRPANIRTRESGGSAKISCQPG
jgi:ribonuclease R